ncbi:MAG: hypothetical protein Q8M16_00150 [Pirellulaceae bacterium]|nr:hypothetical protein [Pirellulaceae bacterium]
MTDTRGQQWLEQCPLDAQGRLLVDSDVRLLRAVQEEEIDLLEKQLAKETWEDTTVRSWPITLD